MWDFISSVWAFMSAIPAIISICSVIVMLTDTPKDDALWAKCYKYIEVFALALGKAKDKNPLLDK